MPGLSTGLKHMMKICPVQGEQITEVEEKGGMEVFINPSSYKHTLSNDYNEGKCRGQPQANPKFNSAKTEVLTLPELVFDGTGVVALFNADSVSVMIKQLRKLVYDINGTKHQPNKVCFFWGELRFYGYVSSMVINYTLFKPSGEPLRAKVQLQVISAATVQEMMLRANMSSPDLTHLVEVCAGDTLPLLCQRVYRDTAYYLEVARLNGLVDFRNLKPGMQLRFPPLR